MTAPLEHHDPMMEEAMALLDELDDVFWDKACRVKSPGEK